MHCQINLRCFVPTYADNFFKELNGDIVRNSSASIQPNPLLDILIMRVSNNTFNENLKIIIDISNFDAILIYWLNFNQWIDLVGE